jgi:hypothetical protein
VTQAADAGERGVRGHERVRSVLDGRRREDGVEGSELLVALEPHQSVVERSGGYDDQRSSTAT